jgi:hypothetical protein
MSERVSVTKGLRRSSGYAEGPEKRNSYIACTTPHLYKSFRELRKRERDRGRVTPWYSFNVSFAAARDIQ